VSDYETGQKRRNLIVGIFVLFGVTALVWLIFKFGDLPGFVAELDSYHVYVQFPNAMGVEKDTAVDFCGYQVGRVTGISPPKVMEDLNTHKFFHQTLVVLSIDKKYKDIPKTVEVKLMTRGLGSSYIELKLRNLDVNEPIGPFLKEGSQLQGSTGMTSEFFPEESQKQLSELIEGINDFVGNANDVIGNRENKENTRKVLANLAEASGQAKQTLEQFGKFAAAGTTVLKHADGKVDEVVTSLVDTSGQVKEFASAGTSTLQNVDAKADKLLTSLMETTEQLSRSMGELRSVLEKINSGDGTAGKLLNDGALYEHLLEDSKQLKAVLEEMQAFIADWRNKKIDVKLF
jgi:phospholipid/cholesterol/gamma-HCH transport system substrate-binding protein